MSLEQKIKKGKIIHAEILKLRESEKRISAEILEKLQLMENRRSYLPLGYSSLFDYLTRGLGYSPSRAYERQSCIRLTKELPELKDKIQQGKLSYSTLSTAFKSLKNKPVAEKREVLKSLEDKSTREVKMILAEPAKPIHVKSSAYQDKVIVRLELSHELNAKLEKLKALRAHALARKSKTSGLDDIECLFEEFLEEELRRYKSVSLVDVTGKTCRTSGQKKIRPKNSTSTNCVRSKSKNPRLISRRLENHLLEKANYKCQYPGCEATHFLQVDHVKPVRLGGGAEPENLQILCAAHNRMKG